MGAAGLRMRARGGRVVLVPDLGHGNSFELGSDVDRMRVRGNRLRTRRDAGRSPPRRPEAQRASP
jgi:hypothetical protein